MQNQILKDRIGNKIGEVREQGNRFIIVDRIGNKMGSYDPKTNTTYDHIGNKYGTGNLLSRQL